MFDELVNVKDAFTNVTVSPLSASTPRVSTSGRKVIVNFEDTLLPSTTYNIDFGNSVVDNNEGNIYKGLSFAFSTGDDIDSLRISGVVLDASTLEPQSGVMVGAYSNLADSAFKTLRMERATRTDEFGRFVLRALKPIPYRVVALADLNNDARWDNPEENLAFYSRFVTPYTTSATATDTIYDRLTGRIDTIVQRNRTRFEPADLFLPLFNTGYKTQYLTRYERPDSLRLAFTLNTIADSLPSLEIIKPSPVNNRLYILEHSATNDTLTYWLTERPLASADTIEAVFTYPRTDNDRRLAMVSDTLILTKPRINTPAPKKRRSDKEIAADSIAAVKAMQLSVKGVTPVAGHEVWRPVEIEFAEPLASIDYGGFHVEQKEDTVWKPVEGWKVDLADSLSRRRYKVTHPLALGATYRLTVDTLAAEGITGRRNAPFIHQYTVKREGDYARLKLRLTPDTLAGFVEILTTADMPVAVAKVVNGVADFPYLGHQEYYARFIADTSGDGKWTPGDYDSGRQPEDVYYFPGKISLKRFDRSETWDLFATPVDMQKPDAIKKNKPTKRRSSADKKQENTADEEDDYFDVTRNPFDPSSGRRRPTPGSY